MKIFGLGMPELVIILIIVCLIFGPKYLPKLGKAFGKTVSALREGLNNGKKEAEKTDQQEMNDKEQEPKRRKKQSVRPKPALESAEAKASNDEEPSQEQATENQSPVTSL